MRTAVLEVEATAEEAEHTARAIAFYLVAGPSPLPHRVMEYLRDVRDEALDMVDDLRAGNRRRGD